MPRMKTRTLFSSLFFREYWVQSNLKSLLVFLLRFFEGFKVEPCANLNKHQVPYLVIWENISRKIRSFTLVSVLESKNIFLDEIKHFLFYILPWQPIRTNFVLTPEYLFLHDNASLTNNSPFQLLVMMLSRDFLVKLTCTLLHEFILMCISIDKWQSTVC